VPIEESVGALVDLRRAGKIQHIGISNVSAAELSRARRLTEIVSVQNCYNLRDRSSDSLIDICAAVGIAFIPSWHRFCAISLWIFVLFLIYVTASEVSHLFGPGGLRRLFFTSRPSELQLNRRQRIRELCGSAGSWTLTQSMNSAIRPAPRMVK
jgi:hypothetical protein